MNPKAAERVFPGEVASRGLVTGVVQIDHVDVVTQSAAGTLTEERARLETAIAAARSDLAALVAASDETGGEILEFQLALIEDPELFEPAYGALADGTAAAAAWRNVLDGQIADYQSAEDDYFRARAEDLTDLRDRVIRHLAGASAGQGEAPENAIFVAQDLAPSRFLETDWSRYRGAALTRGSASGHVAILARARGVPLLIGLEATAGQIETGTEAVLDAQDGRLIVNPAPDTWSSYRGRIEVLEQERRSAARHLDGPAVTRAGERVTVNINVDDPRLLDGIEAAHCDGVGLTRSEFLFYGPEGLPDEETQFRAYRDLLRWADGRPVVIRTLDAGGDKPIPGLTPDGETNPFLGLRGLRLSLARPEVFRVQLRALARAAVHGALKVMLPMVTTPGEFGLAKALFEEVLGELAREGVAAGRPALGMMVEVPAAAIGIAAFEADFYSIGSNDLTQYVTASSRDCAEVATLHDAMNPAVLELIARVVAHGRDSGKEVSLCGDMAAEPNCLTALLDRGLRSVSVAPAALAEVKAGIAAYG